MKKALLIMSAIVLVLGAGVSRLSAQAAKKMVVGYYYPGSTPSYTYTAIRYDCLTHIAHAFILATSTGALDMSGFTLYPQLNQRAHEKGVKVVVSVGGWGNDKPFAAMAADTAARRKFVQNLKNFCVTNNYDGADIDWEYPTTADKANYTALIHELRAAFNTVTPRLSLSAAMSAYPGSGYDFAAITGDFDWIGMMTYDFYGTWTPKAGPNSPLYGTYATTDQGWIDNSATNYLGKGVPASKLLIGTAFYGWNFKTGALYAAQSGATQSQYRLFIANLANGWTRTWDAATRTPYMQDAARTQLITYDDSASIVEKCEYVKAKNLAGTIVWAIGQDYTYPRAPLLETIGRSFFNVTEVASGQEEETQAPGRFELEQNYPNPFNPSTTIVFALGAKQHVKLEIFSVLGEKVAALVDGELEAGSHSVEWNASRQPSGAYFCRLTAGGSMGVKTMVLQK
ncbi:MAG: glycosyl hydrolase family 18 protein [Acidobacteriota bacterium]